MKKSQRDTFVSHQLQSVQYSSNIYCSESETICEETTQAPLVGDTNKFELMHVTVIIYGLSGILCEKEPVKLKRFGKKAAVLKAGESESKGSTVRSSVSTISSIDASAIEEAAFIDNPNAPTTAVVSFRKNAFSSQTAMESFLPSTPLQIPSSFNGLKVRYAASWPADESSLVRDQTSIERSSLKLIRCMQQEPFVPGRSRSGAVTNYVHETIELHLNLNRGKEMIPLGTAALVLSGDEEGEVQMNVPAKPLRLKAKKLAQKRFKSKSKSKTNKHGYFSNDSSRRFFLDENATLRVGVQVIPQEALKVAEERDKQLKVAEDREKILKAEEERERQSKASGKRDRQFKPDKLNIEDRHDMEDVDFKQILERIGDENLEMNEDENPFKNFSLSKLKTALAAPSPDINDQLTPPQSSGLPSFFCGAMMCNTTGITREKKADIPLEIVHTSKERYQYGVASLMSSVSESTDGSDYSEGEIEVQAKDLRLGSPFRKAT